VTVLPASEDTGPASIIATNTFSRASGPGNGNGNGNGNGSSGGGGGSGSGSGSGGTGGSGNGGGNGNGSSGGDGSAGGSIAYTGLNVGGPLTVALLLLPCGAAARVVGRRRKAGPQA
jgi:hypothetical protein